MTTLRGLTSIQVEVTGARGQLGIDLVAAPTPGQFLVSAPGGGRKFNTATGTGADAGLRTDLAAPTGGGNVGIKSSIPTSPAIIDANKLGSRRADVRDWNGTDLTGGNDGTSIMADAFAQAAIAGVALESPAGIVSLTAPVELPAGGVFKGVSGLYMAGTYSGRTILNIAHSGKGITVTGASGGRAIKHVATRRTQPALASGFTPNPHDFDVVCNGATDIEFEDILLINPTKGILCTNGGGRFSFRKVWGQPLNTGIQIDTSLDVSRIIDMHFWDFWSSGKAGQDYVRQYMVNNATSLYSKRNDNAEFSSLFSIFYRIGLRIGKFTGPTGDDDPSSGTTQRLRVFGAGFDGCGAGLSVDGDTNGASAELHGFYAHGNDSIIAPASLIDIYGSNCDIRSFGKTDLSNAALSAISVSGSGSAFTGYDVSIKGFNLANGSTPSPAISVSDLAFAATLRGEIAISGGVGTSPSSYSTTGRINGKTFRSYASSITVAPSNGGSGFVPAVNSAVYSVLDGEVDGTVDIGISNGGASPSGSLLIGVPITTNAGLFGAGWGDDVVGGNSLRVHIPNGSNTIQVTTFNNGYPAQTGARLVVSFRYRI